MTQQQQPANWTGVDITFSPASLDELMEYLSIVGAADVKWDGLPKFGGDEPAHTLECWSWDEDRVMVGLGASRLEIMTRQEWASTNKQTNQPTWRDS